jgi:hypothetical protein
MFKFTHTSADGVEVTMTIPGEHHMHSEVTLNFEFFLRACGYYLDGHLELVNDDECQRDVSCD